MAVAHHLLLNYNHIPAQTTFQCYVMRTYAVDHPSYVNHGNGCQPVQTRFYTDTACSNSGCTYHISGDDSHIEAYFHTPQ